MSGDNSGDRGKRFEEVAMTIRNRAGGRCQHKNCDQPVTQTRKHVHHLIKEKEVPEDLDPHAPSNLVALCEKCHPKLEGKSMPAQLRMLDIHDHTELILSDNMREKLNDRLNNIGPDALNVKNITREDSEKFIQRSFEKGNQSDLFSFGSE